MRIWLTIDNGHFGLDFRCIKVWSIASLWRMNGAMCCRDSQVPGESQASSQLLSRQRASNAPCGAETRSIFPSHARCCTLLRTRRPHVVDGARRCFWWK